MKHLDFAGLRIAWDASALPFDAIEPALPLPLDPDAAADAAGSTSADLTFFARRIDARAPNPAGRGGVPVLYQASTHCFALDRRLVLWDGASELRIDADGRVIDADVHDASLAEPFRFYAVTVTMAVLLALRSRGFFHMHAGAARDADGRTWIVPGESGAGKSTLSLALFASGAEWLSDDAVLLRTVGDEVEVWGWTRMLQVTEATAAAHPTLRPFCTPCPKGSRRDWRIDPRRAFPARGLQSARAPFVLVFPSVGEGGPSRLVPLSRAEAFGRAMHAAAWVATDAHPEREAQLAALAGLVDRARAFELVGGPEWLVDPLAALATLAGTVSRG